MHETDMTKALIVSVRDWYEAQSEAYTIKTIYLKVGEFTCVEPASLQFAFEVQTRNTFLAGVKLEIQDIPLVAYCHPCQQEYKPDIGLQYSCPTCNAPMEDIRSGRELKIDHIQYAKTQSKPISIDN